MEKCKAALKSEDVLAKYKFKQFIKIIEKEEPIKEFDVNLFLKLIEKIIVSLLDGTEIESVIE